MKIVLICIFYDDLKGQIHSEFELFTVDST